ncbi:MAG: acetamidase/formamidase family protein [Candidatus Solibacter sp.]
MRRLPVLLYAFALSLPAQTPAGQWISNFKFFDNNNYRRMELKLDGSTLTGSIGRDTLEATFRDGKIEGTLKRSDGSKIAIQGRLAGERVEGTVNLRRDIEYRWEAERMPATASSPSTHTFEPTQFQHHFSAAIAPVLRVKAGDTVKTWSVDAGGTDPKGVRRTSGGNPLTGPFYVEGAVPGDTLAIHFTRIRLNRDTAISGGQITNQALTSDYIEDRKLTPDYDSDWKLDRAAGFAMLKKPSEALKNYKVPLAPMLGCVGVAPPGGNQYRTGYLANFGGNLDYREVREGVTVYLPVYVPGALLFVGDGHAAQGAGELTGDALETSMDIEFTVEIQPGVSPDAPRFESDTYLMASGITGSLDDALREATTNLVRWLEKKYGLTANEVSSVLGTSMVYEIAEIVDPQVHVVAKISKAALAGLKPVQ